MPSLLDNPVDRVRKHRNAVKERGGAVIGGFTLAPGDDATMWKRLLMDHGGPKAAFVYLLRQEAGRGAADLSDAQLLAMLATRLRRAGEDQSEPAAKGGTKARAVRPKPSSDANSPDKSS